MRSPDDRGRADKKAGWGASLPADQGAAEGVGWDSDGYVVRLCHEPAGAGGRGLRQDDSGLSGTGYVRSQWLSGSHDGADGGFGKTALWKPDENEQGIWSAFAPGIVDWISRRQGQKRNLRPDREWRGGRCDRYSCADSGESCLQESGSCHYWRTAPIRGQTAGEPCKKGRFVWKRKKHTCACHERHAHSQDACHYSVRWSPYIRSGWNAGGQTAHQKLCGKHIVSKYGL